MNNLNLFINILEQVKDALVQDPGVREINLHISEDLSKKYILLLKESKIQVIELHKSKFVDLVSPEFRRVEISFVFKDQEHIQEYRKDQKRKHKLKPEFELSLDLRYHHMNSSVFTEIQGNQSKKTRSFRYGDFKKEFEKIVSLILQISDLQETLDGDDFIHI